MEAQVYKKIIAWLTRRPRSQDAWHVSDLQYPRKAYWGRLDPQPITELQAGYFIAGIGHHNVVEAILGPRNNKGHRADAGEFMKEGIYFSPDLRLPYPLEFKTSRADFEPRDYIKGYDGYLRQLKMYMALMNSTKGGLLVFFLVLKDGHRKKPAFRFYKVTCTKDELVKWRAEIKEVAKKLTQAVESKDHTKLKKCPQWMCGDCVWAKKCLGE